MSEAMAKSIELLNTEIESIKRKNAKLIEVNSQMQNEIRIFKKLFRAMRTIIESGESR